jgi:hypothetical protein
MTNIVRNINAKTDWQIVLGEAHRYILHYSTVRVGLVTFLITASTTALVSSLPKETTQITTESVKTFHGSFSFPIFLFSMVFFGAALLMNWVFDRRRYVMERLARDIELNLDAIISGAPFTAQEHSLDILGPDVLHTIVQPNPGLKALRLHYLKDCKVYSLSGNAPALNWWVTLLFLLYFSLLVGGLYYGYVTQNQLKLFALNTSPIKSGELPHPAQYSFASGQICSDDTSDEIGHWVKGVADSVSKSAARSGISIGSADVTPLTPKLRGIYGNNVGLAFARANCIAERIENELVSRGIQVKIEPRVRNIMSREKASGDDRVVLVSWVP